MYKVATFALNGSRNKDVNLDNLVTCIDTAAAAEARLVVFPEVSLQGYQVPGSVGSRSEVLKDIYAGAEAVPDGPSVRYVAEHARKRGIYVVYGLNEATDEPGFIYNTAVLTGPDGHIGSYRKVHIGSSETAVWQSGSEWPVFNTELGHLGLLICYDKSWPESTRELLFGGADMFVMLSAWGILPDAYTIYDCARALENSRWLISSNYAGSLAGSEYFGLSQIINPSGTVVASSGQTTSQVMVTADIDLKDGITTALADFTGARINRDRKPGTYRRSYAPR